MISIFGIISVVIAVVSVTIIVLHNRLMLKRAPVDTYFTSLEDLIRERIENLYSQSHPDSELRAICAISVDFNLNGMIEALPDIDMASEKERAIDDKESCQIIRETTEALNQAIEGYNRLITGSLPMKLMAQILALTTEETVNINNYG